MVTTVEPPWTLWLYTPVLWSGSPPNRLAQKPGFPDVVPVVVPAASEWELMAPLGTPAAIRSCTAASA